jgi:hypothetical protein
MISVSYVVTFVGEILAALPSKASDPLAWLLLCGALLIGAGMGWTRSEGRRGWWLAAFIGVISFTIAYASRLKLPHADSDALIVICVVGLYAGFLSARLLGRRVSRS